MRELLELRLSAEEAALYVPGYATKGLDPLDTVRLHLDVNDPLVEKLRAIDAGYQTQGTTLFTMCAVRRHYTPRELQAAEHLKVEFWPFFMPSGEECGTPCITGFELRPVLTQGGKPTEAWHQLIIPSAMVETVPPTLFGGSYLAPKPDETRCPRGHVLGRRLLSPLHVARSSLKALDWQALRGLLGARQGLFRPHPLFIISQRLYRLLKKPSASSSAMSMESGAGVITAQEHAPKCGSRLYHQGGRGVSKLAMEAMPDSKVPARQMPC